MISGRTLGDFLLVVGWSLLLLRILGEQCTPDFLTVAAGNRTLMWYMTFPFCWPQKINPA